MPPLAATEPPKMSSPVLLIEMLDIGFFCSRGFVLRGFFCQQFHVSERANKHKCKVKKRHNDDRYCDDMPKVGVFFRIVLSRFSSLICYD